MNISRSSHYGMFIFAVLLLLGVTAFGQLVEQPLPATSSGNRSVLHQNARKQAITLDLPFFDDFSDLKAVADSIEIYPDPMRWVDSASTDVYINNTMAINPPSLNVATFDGLDSSFIAYSSQVLFTGFNDELRSVPIDMSLAKVSAAERSSVFLSFFYQWQGNGEAPDNDDFLQVEFLNDDSVWTVVAAISPRVNFLRSEFYDTLIAITNEKFFHEGFQFRFRNFGRQSGPFDTWNLDFVYLNKGRSASEESLPDHAFASPLTSPFGEYQSVPYEHFKLAKPGIDSMLFEVKNLRDYQIAINFSATATFTNYIDSTAHSHYVDLFNDSTIGIKRNQDGGRLPTVEAFEYATGVYDEFLPDTSSQEQFHPDADSLDITFKLALTQREEGADLIERLKFSPYNLRVNDTISQTFRMHNYYAYDDGTAEYAAGLIEPENRIAVLFEMLESDTLKADTLVGIEVYFPAHGVTDNQTITFAIYRDDGNTPGNALTGLSRRVERKGLNEFNRIMFQPAILVDRKFWIGWRQPIQGKALVGLDKDNDRGDKVYVDTGGGWFQNQTVSGALMIRPIFGNDSLQYETGIEDEKRFALYPNPNQGSFYIEGHFDELSIFNVIGQKVHFQQEVTPQHTTVHVDSKRGIYIVRIRKNRIVETHKIFIEDQ